MPTRQKRKTDRRYTSDRRFIGNLGGKAKGKGRSGERRLPNRREKK